MKKSNTPATTAAAAASANTNAATSNSGASVTNPRSSAGPKTGSGRRRYTSAGSENAGSNPFPIPNLLNSYDGFLDSLTEMAITCPYPEWSDADIQAEKWVTKHAFEETEPFKDLPKSLRSAQVGFKRAIELTGVVSGDLTVVSTSSLSSSLAPQDDPWAAISPLSDLGAKVENEKQLEPLENTDKSEPPPLNEEQAEPTFPPDVNVSNNPEPENQELAQEDQEDGDENSTPSESEDRPSKLERQKTFANIIGSMKQGPSNVFQGVKRKEPPRIPYEAKNMSRICEQNMHLLMSDFMRDLLQRYSVHVCFYRQWKAAGSYPEDPCLWDAIYPKGKDGLPSYNPSGKYAVKLYFLGAWRKVIVDDRVPVSSDGKPLLISSTNPSELWPLILTKAICKITNQANREIEFTPEMDILHYISGSIPEIISKIHDSNVIWHVLGHCMGRQSLKSSNVSSVNLANSSTTTSSTSHPVPSAGASKSAPTKAFTLLVANYSNVAPIVPSISSDLIKGDKLLIRIAEIKEVPLNDEVGVSNANEILTGSRTQSFVRLIKIKIFANHLTPLSLMTTRDDFTSGETSINTIPSSCASCDVWITFSEFMEKFSNLVLYHSIKVVPVEKSVKRLQSATEDGFMNYNPLVLYSEANSPIQMLSLLNAGGKIKNAAQIAYLEPFDWKKGTSNMSKPVVKLPTLGNQAVLVSLPSSESKMAYRLVTECPQGFSFNCWSAEAFGLEDEASYIKNKLGLFVLESEGSYPAQNAHAWFLLFRHKIMIPTAMNIFFKLDLLDPGIRVYCNLKVFDCDTNKAIPFNNQALNLNPNRNGYIVSVDCRTPISLNSSKFRLRIYNDAAPLLAPEQVSSGFNLANAASTLSIQDFEEVFLPNRSYCLFRHVIKGSAPDAPISVQLSMTIPNVNMTLQLLAEEKLIYEVKGKGILYIPNYILWQEDGGAPRNKCILQAFAEENDIINYVLMPYASFYTSSELQGMLGKSRKVAAVPITSITTDKAKKKDKAASESVAKPSTSGSVPEEASIDAPMWKLRVISNEISGINITRDSEKDERCKGLKQTWETENPGRTSKAKDTRENFLRNRINPNGNSSVNINGITDATASVNINESSADGTMSKWRSTVDNNFNATLASIFEKEPFEFMTQKRKNELWSVICQSYAVPSRRLIANAWSQSESQGDQENIIPTDKPFLVNQAIRELFHQEKTSNNQTFTAYYQNQVLQERENEKQLRTAMGTLPFEQITRSFGQWKQDKDFDDSRREAYRNEIIKRLEEIAAANAPPEGANGDAEKEKAASAGKKGDKDKDAKKKPAKK